MYYNMVKGELECNDDVLRRLKIVVKLVLAI